MNISNIRFGFANNSSSSHSIIFADNISDDNVPNDGGFGWENFTLASKDAKDKYLMAVLKDNIHRFPEWIIKSIIKEYFGECPDNIMDYYIDHQSEWTIPMDYNGETIDIEFFKQLKDYVSNSNMVIYGGNDNSDTGSITGHNLKIKDIGRDWRCRYDNKYQYWSLFNSYDGTKFRLRFDDNILTKGYYNVHRDKSEIKKSSTPELVDICITKYCDMYCNFCYQNCDIHGKHAKKQDIYQIIHMLKDMKIWEVALGGGEPTKHPDFIDIIKTLKSYNIVANFTTRSNDWLDDSIITKAVRDNCSSFAYSIGSSQEILPLYRTFIKNELKNFAFQIIPGIINKEAFEKIYTMCSLLNVPLTLLGIKYCGRGKSFNNVDTSWLFPTLFSLRKNHGFLAISIDEQLVLQHYDDIVNSESIHRIFYDEPDCKFSCYIDAVNLTMARNSYSDSNFDITKINGQNKYISSDLIKEIYEGF